MKKFKIETVVYKTKKATGGRHSSGSEREKELYSEDESDWVSLRDMEDEVHSDIFSILTLINKSNIGINEINLCPTYKYFEYCVDNTSYEECKEYLQTIKIK